MEAQKHVRIRATRHRQLKSIAFQYGITLEELLEGILNNMKDEETIKVIAKTIADQHR